MEKLAENIRYFRVQRGWTQQELANRLNVSRSVLTKWENNMLIPDLPALIRLSDIFEVSIDGLVGRVYHKDHILKELRRIYQTDSEGIDEQMLEIIAYLNKNAELRSGLFELSRMSAKNRKPVEEILKVIFRENVKS